MNQELTTHHLTNAGGFPDGGYTTGTGISITWQRGALVDDGERQKANGAYVEGVISAAIDRLEHFQAGYFACDSNAAAIQSLNEALSHLESRTAERVERGVEGTHTV
jgi:hypothetical protein